jgi:hypothetical protein
METQKSIKLCISVVMSCCLSAGLSTTQKHSVNTSRTTFGTSYPSSSPNSITHLANMKYTQSILFGFVCAATLVAASPLGTYPRAESSFTAPIDHPIFEHPHHHGNPIHPHGVGMFIARAWSEYTSYDS